MSLSSAKICDHAVIEQIYAARSPRLPELPHQLRAPPLTIHSWVFPIRIFGPRSRSGPSYARELFARSVLSGSLGRALGRGLLRPREKWRVSA
jgi:hypothetical protein